VLPHKFVPKGRPQQTSAAASSAAVSRALEIRNQSLTACSVRRLMSAAGLLSSDHASFEPQKKDPPCSNESVLRSL
jgi:hypothetical protein